MGIMFSAIMKEHVKKLRIKKKWNKVTLKFDLENVFL